MKRFTTSDGLSLAYRDEGNGPPLLCLPGLTRNSADFDPVAERFGAGLRLIRLDPRGRGASDYDPDPANYNVGVEARDALELMDHLGLARVPVLGTSRGGLQAMVIAAAAPQRLAGVMFNDVGPVLEQGGIDHILGHLGRVPPHADFDAAASALEASSRDQFPGVSVAAWRAHAARIWHELPGGGLALRYDPRLRDGFEAGLQALEPGAPLPDMWPLFDALPMVPLALLRGANSGLISPATAEAMAARRPDLVVTVVADRGHVPFLDEPEAVDAIAAFLARVAA
jgi:pimeloyl-ACP methyl ester carboxylesterase